ncbi:UNVERIFIED_CONTAM: hypothetical protein RMT77_009018 [Armadillidium vulgare]
MFNSLVLLSEKCELKTSTVLNKNSKEYGKQFLIDGSDETCWCSDSGIPQWVAIKWDKPVNVFKIEAKFQGGFCGNRDTTIEAWDDEAKSWKLIENWPLEDIGSKQTLTLKEHHRVTRLRLLFNSSTDFFGRIIMYELSIWGENSD